MLIVLFKKCVDKIRIKKKSSSKILSSMNWLFLSLPHLHLVGVTRLLGEEKKASNMESSTKINGFQQSSTEINNWQR